MDAWPSSRLNLLELATGGPAQLGAGPPQIVGGEIGESELARVAEHDPPDHFRRHRLRYDNDSQENWPHLIPREHDERVVA
jgi:hypothetical protein